MRRNVTYLDFIKTKKTRNFEHFLEAIEKGFSNPGLLKLDKEVDTGNPQESEDKWIFSLDLQALGDMMIEEHDG